MHYGVVFSICAHENYDVCITQFSNYKFFCPNSLIIVHVNESLSFTADELRKKIKLFGLDDVVVSENSIKLQWGCGRLVYAHYLNYLFISKLGISFKYFSTDASNSMLYRSGLSDHMSYFDCGFRIRSSLDRINFIWDPLLGELWERSNQFGMAIYNDVSLNSLLDDLEINAVCGNGNPPIFNLS